MADPADAQVRSVRFGPFELDCRAGELRKYGIRIKLREQPILILGMLLDRPGQVVLREEIRLRLWSTDTIVEFDHGINSAIQKLRNALGDSAADPRYVETVARRGYRFLREVEKVGDDSAEPVDQHPSIAVLPFANMSADQENDYFCDGLAEEILNLLAKIPGLKVIARTSAFTFRNQEQDIRKIAETLGVRNVLEGSVRRAGDRVRIAVQLINAGDGACLWAERYDRDLTDIFAIQNEIGQSISEALNVWLAPRAQTVNIEAYQNYLKGQFYRQRLTPETAAKAKECFGRALAIDPNYAAAHSGLASYYHSLAVLTTERSGDIAPLAKSAAEKALAIDPVNSEAHSILATVAGIVDYEWKASEAHFRKAMAVEPVPAMVRFRYVWYFLLAWGRIDESKEQSRLGLETDPLCMFLHSTMTASMYFAKQYREAIEYGKRSLEIDANFYSVWFLIGLAQVSAGLAQEAIGSFHCGVDLAPWYTEGQWYLAAAYHLAGDRQRSGELARKLADQHGHTLGAASFHAAVGDVERMAEALEGAYSQRDPRLHFVSKRPIFDSYRADSRFQALLQRMNLS